MLTFPLLLTIYAGFTHAFEADHLLAVSSIVSRRNNLRLSVKDGIYWGLGHSSTIFLVGILMILFKAVITPQYFHYFEAVVGAMLIALAVYRLREKFVMNRSRIIAGLQDNHHAHNDNHQHAHGLAYSIGLVHGLAGSGALIVIVMSEMKGPLDGLTYLLIFGLGCIGGMMLASGLFSIPFSQKIMQGKALQATLIMLSSLLCLVYGVKVIYENLLA